MKKQILFAVIILGLGIGIGYVFPHKQNLPQNSVVIIPTDDVDGRPIFSVLFQDSSKKALDYMYGEEIVNGLATGNREYDENISVPLVSLKN